MDTLQHATRHDGSTRLQPDYAGLLLTRHVHPSNRSAAIATKSQAKWVRRKCRPLTVGTIHHLAAFKAPCFGLLD